MKSGSQSKINEAAKVQIHEPMANRMPAGGGSGSVVSDHSLGGAVKELQSQHPIGHHDHGPHHGMSNHIRHMPLHGLKGR